MAQHDRSLNAQPVECLLEQVCLCLRGPSDIPGPQAMSKSRAVEHDHPVILGRQINQAARLEILDHAATAVKENERPATAALYVVQMYPIDVDKPPLRWIVLLRFPSKLAVNDGCRRHQRSCCREGGDYGISPEGNQTVGEKRGRT